VERLRQQVEKTRKFILLALRITSVVLFLGGLGGIFVLFLAETCNTPSPTCECGLNQCATTTTNGPPAWEWGLAILFFLAGLGIWLVIRGSLPNTRNQQVLDTQIIHLRHLIMSVRFLNLTHGIHLARLCVPKEGSASTLVPFSRNIEFRGFLHYRVPSHPKLLYIHRRS
jgi:hypothetical protein